MKKFNSKKSMVVILVFMIVMLTVIPAFAQGTSSVDVRFVVKNQNGPYKGVTIQFGNNTKVTGNRGTCEFRLEGIPSTTMVNAHLVDPYTPSGYNCAINLELAGNRSVKVNDYGPGSSNIHIKYTEDTKTIVVEFSVGGNDNYGYKSATFKQKIFSKPSNPAPASTPQPPKQDPPPPAHEQNPPPPNHEQNPPPQDGFDPDMMHEENHEEFNPEHFEGMMPEGCNPEDFEGMNQEEFNEAFNQEHFEGMPPEGHHENMPRDDFNRKSNSGPMIPGYVWIIVGVGALIVVMMIILIIVMIRKK